MEKRKEKTLKQAVRLALIYLEDGGRFTAMDILKAALDGKTKRNYKKSAATGGH